MSQKIKSHWNERWCQVPAELDTIGKTYHFSDYGRLKSVDKQTEKETLLKGSNTVQGYTQINVRFKNKTSKGFYVHKIIADKWLEKGRDDQTFVIHIDRNKKNNHYSNLKWMSLQELTAFKAEVGTYLTKNRKRNANYKMNPTLVRLLRKKLAEGKTKKKVIAKQFGISESHIEDIIKGKAWGWVDADSELTPEPEKENVVKKKGPRWLDSEFGKNDLEERWS